MIGVPLMVEDGSLEFLGSMKALMSQLLTEIRLMLGAKPKKDVLSADYPRRLFFTIDLDKLDELSLSSVSLIFREGFCPHFPFSSKPFSPVFLTCNLKCPVHHLETFYLLWLLLLTQPLGVTLRVAAWPGAWVCQVLQCVTSALLKAL